MSRAVMKMYRFHVGVGLVPTQQTTQSLLASSYAIGPIDPARLTTLQLSNSQEISLLVPTHLPLSVLNDPEFKDGYEWGYFECDAGEEWTVPQMVNHIYLALRRELWGEHGLSRYAWVVGFLLGNLTSLAETERTLALVGIAHLCFLLACVPPNTLYCYYCKSIEHMRAQHTDALCAYRARVRVYRGQGMSFQDAQRLALAGCVQEDVLRNTLKGNADHEQEDR